jgi:hypothetical protein
MSDLQLPGQFGAYISASLLQRLHGFCLAGFIPQDADVDAGWLISAGMSTRVTETVEKSMRGSLRSC